ncbi:MAG: mercuric transporter MerT family protein [Candidatus Omnitrophota bacterium]|nr:mercuric transporter MerT family protein [Candidatus Omnitrophota bacterium]
MKADKLGILSALFASVCCVTPLLLVLLGLGSLGIGAVLGRFHWWFLGAALILLTAAWRRYFQERRRCATECCEMASGTPTRWTLLVVSLVVAAFAGLNLVTFASQRQQTAPTPGSPSDTATEAVIPVEGMTCLTCELTIESGLKRLQGIQHADARMAEQAVSVQYDPTQISLNDVVEAINKIGYRARLPD